LLVNFGVLPKPHVVTRMLEKEDLFLVLATDGIGVYCIEDVGVWEVMSDSEVMSYISDYESPKEAAVELVNQAVSLKSIADNSTAVVVFLR